MSNNEWNELQKEAKDLGVLERGMTQSEIREAVTEARGRPDDRSEQLKVRDGGRIPFGGFRQNLTVPEDLKREGLHYRFVQRENLQRARQAGYHPVMRSGAEFDPAKDERNEDQWFTVAKGRQKDGSPSVNYLMSQPLVFREEDQAYRRAELDATEEAMRMGRPTGQESGATYVPTDSAGRPNINFERENR